ncbi:heat stress transcription factor A-5 [Andrographis paniculata]|uniref:heat stress transcription factor A-5 n=1 Tax=Andrographis paniculata TaxID=175694 RepID=UPI0021E979BF|nr:heat stress transcription factor A-5 [Andrographis paniculata]
MDGGGGGGGGPAPFLLKTYEMVDDPTTNAIVSWSRTGKSFVVWNPPEFARVLLPSYFKHNNFSSFIRQLNTYGFRKIDPEKWEFANDEFMKDQKHLLKNIHRRKPIHSHSQPQGSVDPERAAFEEEIDKLSREKSVLEEQVLGFKDQQSAAKAQLEDLMPRIGSIEQRQERLLSFLEKSVQNPEFVKRLVQKLESMDFSAYNKKRRLPQADNSVSVQENALVDNQSSCQPNLCDISHQDFCNKLRLELSPTVTNADLLCHSTQSSNEDGASPPGRMNGFSSDIPAAGTAGVLSPSETVELSDTGASFNLKTGSSISSRAGPESPRLHSLHHGLSLASNDEGDGHISCRLNLTLASSHLELNNSRNPDGTPSPEVVGTLSRLNSNDQNEEIIGRTAAPLEADGTVSSEGPRRLFSSSLAEPERNKQGPRSQVNDFFWEQFLTERPGCADGTEEASSGFKANHHCDCEEQEDGKSSVKGIARNTEGMHVYPSALQLDPASQPAITVVSALRRKRVSNGLLVFTRNRKEGSTNMPFRSGLRDHF